MRIPNDMISVYRKEEREYMIKRYCCFLAVILLTGLLTACARSVPKEDEAAETEDRCTYTVYAYDSNDKPLAGVFINFCTDDSCVPVTTDAKGTAVFTGAPDKYHVQIIKAPEGWQVDGENEFCTEPHTQEFRLSFTEAKK